MMEERFKSKSISNILNQLSKDDAMRIVALSLAANDLNINVEALDKFPESENIFFFVTSLSILRKLAKLVAEIEGTAFQGRMSADTITILDDVKASLASFEAGFISVVNQNHLAGTSLVHRIGHSSLSLSQIS